MKWSARKRFASPFAVDSANLVRSAETKSWSILRWVSPSCLGAHSPLLHHHPVSGLILGPCTPLRLMGVFVLIRCFFYCTDPSSSGSSCSFLVYLIRRRSPTQVFFSPCPYLLFRSEPMERTASRATFHHFVNVSCIFIFVLIFHPRRSPLVYTLFSDSLHTVCQLYLQYLLTATETRRTGAPGSACVYAHQKGPLYNKRKRESF